MTKLRQNKSSNRLQVTLSAVSHFITDIYQAFIVGLIPLLTLKFGLSLFQVALLTTTSVIANSLFSPVFGFFSDRHGIKYFLIIGPLVSSVFLSLLGIIPNYYLLIICLFIGNLGIAAYHPASGSYPALCLHALHIMDNAFYIYASLLYRHGPSPYKYRCCYISL